jgi:hypothetical protein
MKPTNISVRVPAEARAQLQQAADLHGVTISEVAREILCNAVGYTTPSARLGKALKSLGDNK